MSYTFRHLLPFSLALLLGACGGAEAKTPTGAGSVAWVTGYIVGYERNLLPPADLNWSDLTEAVVGRVVPNADGSLNTTFDIDAVNGPIWARSVVQQAHAHSVKALLMLGGAGEHGGFVGAASAARRAAFVRNILKLVDDYGFDGIDLDWEPIQPGEEVALRALAVSLKAQRPGLLLTIPVNFVNANFPTQEARAAVAALASVADRLNIMSYGMAGVYPGWKSWHSSALAGDSSSTPTSVDSSVQAFLKAGVPAAKLGLGTGFYGLCYQGVSGPGQSAAGMKIVADDGDMSYVNVLAQYLTPAAKKWDSAASVPYLASATPLGPKGCTYLSYEDPQSVALKGSYARAKGLGGTVIWTLGQGHVASNAAGKRDPLLDAVRAAF
ncbi:glycosyl hydrolase family 18 protein [Deinococcus sp.]|uniref:glycosyl hydrolase family 18 protein n=1 Tax=Deinococcus sp. TaxID=47478 RepID=UPI003CC6CE9B